MKNDQAQITLNSSVCRSAFLSPCEYEMLSQRSPCLFWAIKFLFFAHYFHTDGVVIIFTQSCIDESIQPMSSGF